MSKGLIFFCCACAILLFTIINLSVGPIISGKVGRSWGLLNCASISDTIDTLKEGGASDDDLKYAQKWELDQCKIYILYFRYCYWICLQPIRIIASF